MIGCISDGLDGTREARIRLDFPIRRKVLPCVGRCGFSMLMALVHALHLHRLTSKAGCLLGRQAAADEDFNINIMPPKMETNMKRLSAYP